jgi:uncharacterized protein (DUF849 family)
VRIKACLNGGRSREEHPAIPLTPAELAAEGRASVDAGAELLHFHPRDANGGETLDAGPSANAILAVREACPGIPVILSGGLWIARGDHRRRVELIRGWIERPDAVAVNFAEESVVDIIRVLLDLGIGAEAGLVTEKHAHELVDSGVGDQVERILIEPADSDPDRAVATAAAMDEIVAPLGRPRLHHGYLDATWAVIDAAFDRGLDVRVGFEDVLSMPDGRPAESNADLVAEAVRRRERKT